MIDCVKSCAEVEEEENVEDARIRGSKEVVCSFEQGSLGTMVGSEGRSKSVI